MTERRRGQPAGQLFALLDTLPWATLTSILVMLLVASFFVSGADAASIVIGGDSALTGLQNLTIVAAVPFALVMVGIAVGLVKDLRRDPMTVRRRYGAEAVDNAVVDGVLRHGDDFALRVERRRDVDLPRQGG